MNCYKETKTNSLDKGNKLMKMDIRFGTWNVKIYIGYVAWNT